MSIFVDDATRVIVQGITGRDGSFHTQGMLEYGTKVVAGVTPGRGGQTLHGVPIYDSVIEARGATGADTSVIYVPAPFAADAVYEAVDAGMKFIVCITEGIPVGDMIQVYATVERSGARLL
jgi:succinyl-CoA synthetase alpha subunit